VGAGFSYSSGTDVKQLSFQEIASYTTENNKLFQHLSMIMSESDENGFDVDRLETGLGDFVGFYGEISIDTQELSIALEGREIEDAPTNIGVYDGALAPLRPRCSGRSR
jgi:hypothetical protein